MKNWLNSNTEIPVAIGLGGIALLFLIGCLIQWRCGLKGTLIYMGIVVIMIGGVILYIGITDKTL
jgi:hypothetical protein